MIGRGTDIVSIKEFTRSDFEKIFGKAKEFEKQGHSSKCSDKVLASLFYEPSTRTRLSFESAMHRLGGRVITVSNIEGTSEIKGETFEDTIKIVDGYTDVIVVRHPTSGFGQKAADVAQNPVINGGDGANEHPTQTLLDLYTIEKEFGKIDGLTIGLVGDLKYGRASRSLALGLNQYEVSLKLFAPNALEMNQETKQQLKNDFIEASKLDFSDCDVIYVTRVQKERFPDLKSYEALKGSYKIDEKTLNGLKKEAIVMHPLPRVDELDRAVDSSKHARYFQQAKNGLFVRMAVIDCVLNG